MSEKIIELTDLNELIVDESFVSKIEWIADGLNLVVGIDWNGQPDIVSDSSTIKNTHFIFADVFDMKINFDFEDHVGSPHIYEFTFIKHEKYVEICFNFFTGPSGNMKFKCRDARFVIETK